MKRSLFIAIVVLLMATLFVSCNAEKSLEDQLFEVTIDGSSRALQATGEFNVDIDQFYWFYTATKTSGGFRTGEKTVETPVKADGSAGIVGANLGSFSKGTWEFSFYGYASATDKETAAKRIYFQAGLSQTISSAVSLAITLERGEGTLPASTVVFDNPTWYHEDFKTLPANQTTGYELALKVFVGDATEAWKTVTATTVDGKATFAFADTDVLTLAAETTLRFRVYWGADLVGSEDLVIPAAGATKYTVSDLDGTVSGITPVDEQYGVVIFDATVPGIESTEATGTISVSPVDATVVKAGVAPVSTEQTTVTFPAGSFEAAGTHELTIAVADAAAAAETNFVVTNVDTTGAPIAVLSFTLTNAPATFGDEAVEVETFIQPGLDANSIKVIYNGTTGAQPTDVAYDPQTGRLTFKTTHFSDYVVVSTKAVARIGNTLYETLPEACIAALATEGNTVITLLCDASGDGFSPDNAALGSYTIDFAGHTYDVVGLVGSTGTVSQAFRVIQGQSVVLKNGTLTSSTARMLINKYGDLTLTDMTLDGSHLDGTGRYVLSNNSGTTVINGNSSIIAKDGDFALDSCKYSSYPIPSVVINTTGTITGKIELTGGKLNVKAGTINGIENPVAIIGTQVYATLPEAIAAAPENEATVITLIGERIEFTAGYYATIPSSKNITIDLNGNIVEAVCTSEGTSALIRNLGTLTLTDSSSAGTGKLAVVATPSWIWDGTDNYAGSYASNLIRNEGTLIIESGIYENSTGGSAAYVIDNYGTGKVTINGGELTTTKASAIRFFYTNAGASLTIKDGVIGGSASYMGVQLMGTAGTNKATVELTGGEYNGSYSVYAPYGTVSISDGTYNGIVGFGASVPATDIAVTGGVFNAWCGSWAETAKFITGGTFAVDPTDNLAEGYDAKQTGDVWVVEQSGTVQTPESPSGEENF